ncbi:MAG: DUF1598 domain-containing protein [bacterium]|nr:DUF1598 domain-containing protein [bacterium]
MKMAYQMRPHSWALSLVIVCAATSISAQDDVAQLRGHLAAGEFGPARQIAAGVNDPAMRDGILREIVTAQAGAGALNGSASTAWSIGDDSQRSNAFADIQETLRNPGARGGTSQADFDSLISLVTRTVDPESWEELGGPGTIEGFPAGVYVNASGVLHRIASEEEGVSLSGARSRSARSTGNTLAARESSLRMVSLNRLETHVQAMAALGKKPTETMLNLAGIHRVKYLFFYPETGDIVIAGPAGNLRNDPEGRTVHAKTGAPVLQLDDFVTVLRNAYTADGEFGCSITPRKANLAATKAYLETAARKPLSPGRSAREKWLAGIETALGRQDITVHGIDPRTHAARAIVEADYRMKLVGMGLEDGGIGVPSYFELLKADKNKAAGMDVLRWWFTMNYEAVKTNADRNAYQLVGPGARVQSENEMLTDRGERVHTGKSDEPNSEFAHNFSKHFERLAGKHPVYAELRNVFDLALIAAIIKEQDLASQADWKMIHFGPETSENAMAPYQVRLETAPTEVDSIVGYTELNPGQLVAGASGGVSAQAQVVFAPEITKVDAYGLVKANHHSGKPQQKLPAGVWWWD